MVLSENCFYPVEGDISLNRVLREEDFLKGRTIRDREYLDIELSPAFAMVDHQFAHIYIKSAYEKAAHGLLEQIDGIDRLPDDARKSKYRIHHPRSGDLVAVSEKNRWFSYCWLQDRSKEPDYATHVDIHRKPGYDPL